MPDPQIRPDMLMGIIFQQNEPKCYLVYDDTGEVVTRDTHDEALIALEKIVREALAHHANGVPQ